MLSNTKRSSAPAIAFPSSFTTNNISKLSTSPSIKVPHTSDWIFQDFFNVIQEGQQAQAKATIEDLLLPPSNITDPSVVDSSCLLFNEMALVNHYYPSSSSSSSSDGRLSLPELIHNASNSDDSGVEEDDEISSSSVVVADFSNRTFFAPPILIESNISCSTSESEDIPYYPIKESRDTTSSFHPSLQLSAKRRRRVTARFTATASFIVSSTTKKFINYFKRHL
ncbi:MAG: hypothetical protein EXX96DRAFT_626147 [Benjaminiella poitrasii]|nr:MAG: hypothetical protein EXX96DRAFT_626147 [Benjaminiella poitrasii]